MTPVPYADALAPLKDGVAPRGRDVIEPLILQNLSNGTKATSLAALGIKRVEWSKCLGAASVGQVHEAILADGRKAAIKVQYGVPWPGRFSRDFGWMKHRDRHAR